MTLLKQKLSKQIQKEKEKKSQCCFYVFHTSCVLIIYQGTSTGLVPASGLDERVEVWRNQDRHDQQKTGKYFKLWGWRKVGWWAKRRGKVGKEGEGWQDNERAIKVIN